MPKLTREKRIKNLIAEFDEKIDRISKSRPDIAEIQPLKRGDKFFDIWKAGNEAAKKRSERVMLSYLKEGAEERSSKNSNMTNWGAKALSNYTASIDKKRKQANIARPYSIKDDTSTPSPDLSDKSPAIINKSLKALESNDLYEGVPEQYKQNYLTAVYKEIGDGILSEYVKRLSPEQLVNAYYSDPASFDIVFVYSQDEAKEKQNYLIERFEEYFEGTEV